MKRLALLLPLLFFMTATSFAQELDRYQWKSRVLLLFTPSADDPMFMKQFSLLSAQREALEERRLIVKFLTPEGKHENSTVFLDEEKANYYYDLFNAQPYQFEMILVGLDGNEKYRARNAITPTSVIFELIDEMPMRQREILQGYDNKSLLVRKNGNQPAKQRYH